MDLVLGFLFFGLPFMVIFGVLVLLFRTVGGSRAIS